MERKKKGTMFWERHPSSINYPPDDDYYLRYLANKRPKSSLELFNPAPNNQEKKAVLRVLPSVVALISYSGDVEVMEGSGTIIESNNVTTTVLTSANLIRRASVGAFVENNLIDDLKITVYYCGGESYAGEVVAFDYHYNLAAISFQPKAPLSTAKIAVVDDSLDVSPSLPSFELRPHTDSYKLRPGAEVVAVGRFFYEPFAPMVVPGAYWLDRCGYDCKELFKASCTIVKCGEGGPLVNHFGEVIGIIYRDLGSTPFMPISIALKWWEHFKTYSFPECKSLTFFFNGRPMFLLICILYLQLCKGNWSPLPSKLLFLRKYRRPLLGMEAGNFYTADIDVIERVNQLFPSVCNGVFVEKVTKGSSADLAGLCVNDVIIECAGKRLKSFLEFFEMIWESVGNHVNLVVVRQHKVEPLHLTMFVNEATFDQINRWPHRI